MLIYSEAILFPVRTYLFKVNNKNTSRQCEISPKLTKIPPKKGSLLDIPDSDIHSPSCDESDFSSSDADSDAKL